MCALKNHVALRDIGLDAVKGLLILLVVLGHVTFLEHVAPSFYKTLYSFHVAGFLLLGFLFVARPLDSVKMRDLVVRYGVPFGVFYTFYTVLFVGMGKAADGGGIDALGRYLVGFGIASTSTLDAASGLKMFWFLPALLSLALLRGWMVGLGKDAYAYVLISCCVVHVMVGELPDYVRQHVPWGMLIAAYMLPLGLFLNVLLGWIERGGRLGFGLLVFFVGGLHVVRWYTGLKIDLGNVWIFGISDPLYLLLQDGLMVGTTALILALRPWWAKVSGLVALGRESLVIYLVHPLFIQAVLMVWPAVKALPYAAGLWLVASVALAGSYGVAVGMRMFPRLYALLFPAGFVAWKSAWRGVLK